MCRRRCRARGRCCCPSIGKRTLFFLFFFYSFFLKPIFTRSVFTGRSSIRYDIYLPLELRIHRAYRDRISPTLTHETRSHATCCIRCSNGGSFVSLKCIYKTSKIGNKTQTALFSYLKRFYASSMSAPSPGYLYTSAYRSFQC